MAKAEKPEGPVGVEGVAAAVTGGEQRDISALLREVVDATQRRMKGLQGALPERVEAYKQFGLAATTGLFGGYNNSPKALAACWLAESMDVHPGTFVRGVHCIEIDERVTLEAKWEFEHALLLDRLPGYRLEILERSETRAAARFYSARSPKGEVMEYTVEDAKRQGLWDKSIKGTPMYQKHTKEMLWKQMFHRGADIVGADILLGLKGMLMEAAAPSGAPTKPEAVAAASAALDAAIARTVEVGDDPREILGRRLKEVYGAIGPKNLLAKATLILTEIAKQKGLDHAVVQFTRLSEIGPVEARAILDYIDAKWAKDAGVAKEGAVSTPTEPQRATEDPPAPVVPLGVMDPAKDAGDSLFTDPGDAPTPTNGDEEPEELPYGEWTAFLELVGRARKRFDKRLFIQDWPKDSGRHWFCDKRILDRKFAGKSILILEDGKLAVPPEKLNAMGAAIAEELEAQP